MSLLKLFSYYLGFALVAYYLPRPIGAPDLISGGTNFLFVILFGELGCALWKNVKYGKGPYTIRKIMKLTGLTERKVRDAISSLASRTPRSLIISVGDGWYRSSKELPMIINEDDREVYGCLPIF